MAEERDLLVYLRDIEDSLSSILAYTDGVAEDAFARSREKQDAVVRRFEIVGEAVKHVPDEFRARYPQVPWKKMAGMRDVLIHEYFGIATDLVWVTIKDEVPGVLDEIRDIIAAL